MVVACIALVVAISGTSYVALTITGRNVKSLPTITEDTNCPGHEQASVTGVSDTGTQVDPPAFAIAFY